MYSTLFAICFICLRVTDLESHISVDDCEYNLRRNVLKELVQLFSLKSHKKLFFQADHALYTPGLDENRVIGNFVHDIWICYEVHCTKVQVSSESKMKMLR